VDRVRARASHCRDFRPVWDTRPGLRACPHRPMTRGLLHPQKAVSRSHDTHLC
jgi:hypothetical protein